MQTETMPAPNTVDHNQRFTRAGNKYLIFRLGMEHFGIRVLKVREILGLQEITSVPHAPAFLKGVFNLRGKVIPAIDLRLRLQMPPVEYSPRTCIIVVSLSGSEGPVPTGLIVDGVAEVVNVAESDIKPTPSLGADVDTSYLLGIATAKNEVRLMLDIDRTLTTDQFEAMAQLRSAAATEVV